MQIPRKYVLYACTSYLLRPTLIIFTIEQQQKKNNQISYSHRTKKTKQNAIKSINFN